MFRLFQKMLRDIWKDRIQFIAIFIMCFLGVFIYSGIEGVWNGMKKASDQYFSDTNLADCWISGNGFSEADAENIRQLNDVDDAELLSRVTALIKKDEDVIIDVNYSNGDISLCHTVEKADKSSENGIALDYAYAESNDISIGDSIDIFYGGKKHSLVVDELIYSPEYIYHTGNSAALVPNHDKYTYCYVPADTMKSISGEITYNLMELKLEDDCDFSALKPEFRDKLDGKYQNVLERSEYEPVSNFINKIGQIRKMSIMFSLVFFMLALLTMSTTMRRIILKQRGQIGVLKAIGFYNWQIGLHYALYGLLISALGGALGLYLAPYTITPVLLDLQKNFYSMPYWYDGMTFVSVALVVLITLLCMFSALIISQKIVKETTAALLRDAPPKKGKKLLLESVGFVWKKIDFNWKWTLRDMSQNRLRTYIGLIGVLGSMMLLIASFGLNDSVKYINTNIYGTEYTYYEKMYLNNITDDDIKTVEEKLYHKTQWGFESPCELHSSSSIEKENILIYDTGYYMNLFDGKKRVSLPDDGAVISKTVAEENGIHEGSYVDVFLGQNSYRLKVAKIIEIPSPQGIFLSKDYWLTTGGTFMPNVLLAGDVSNVEEVENADYVRSHVLLETQLEEAESVLESVQGVIVLLLLAAIILSVVILYNLGILGYVEKYREYATLRVLGAYNKEIRNLIFKDNLLNLIIGWILGIPVGLFFLSLYVKAVSTSSIMYRPYLQFKSFLIASAITIGCSMIVNYVVSMKISKIDMVEALKSVE